MRPRETSNLQRWREASTHVVATAHGVADLFTDFLAAGGPDAIKSLQATIRKLQAQLEEQKADGRLERYRKLQKDLEECDKVRASLRAALLSCHWTEDEVDAHIQKKLFKANTLYGASREMLLRENRLLRSQLEEHLVTSRTSRLAAASSALGRATPPDSKLKQARMMLGPHMESVEQLREAAEALGAAERSFKLPSVRHAEAQADDGSLTYIQMVEKQLATVAGQKLQLMQQVAALTEQARVLDMKLEGALDQVAELRRQKTEMLAHQDNLSKDLREHLLSEAKRADTAEMALAEAKLAVVAAREAEAAATKEMERALAESQAMQAALQEKAQQVDTLRGLYLELREALERLAGDVTSGQQEAARRLLDATREQFLDQKVLLEDVKSTALETRGAAQHATGQVTELAAQQRVLVSEVVRNGEAAVMTLGAYERQLGITQQLLQQSEADRARLARQAIAASTLNRLEAKRHEKAISLLLHEVPQSVAQRIAPGLQALAEGTQALAEEQTKDTLAEAGVLTAGGRRGPDMLHAPMVPDEVDDATTQLLANSRQLRAQLLNLYPGDPGRAPLPAYDDDDGDGDGGGPRAGARAGAGLPPWLGEHEVPLPAASAGPFADAGRGPGMELVAAAPSPGPPVEPPFDGLPALLGPAGYYAPNAYDPGLMPTDFMHPAYYGGVHPGAGYMLAAPLAPMQAPPARLDMVLQLPPLELPQQPQQLQSASSAAPHLAEPQPPQPAASAVPPLAPSQPQLPPDSQASTWQQQQQTASGTGRPSVGLQADTFGSGQQRAGGTGGSVPDAASIWAPYAHKLDSAVQSGAGFAPGGGGGGTVTELAPVGVETTGSATGFDEQQAGPSTHRPGQPSAGVEAASDDIAVVATDAQAGGRKQGSVDGQALPAHVWVPSPALLAAFKDIQP